MSMKVLGLVSASVTALEIDVKGALVTIRHEDRSDIAVNVNNPGNWKLNGGVLSQTKVNEPLGGGSTVISNGIHIGGSIVGSVISGGSGRTVVNAGGRNVSIINGEVWVDGKKVTGGGEEPASAPSSSGPDKLEVVVPNSFRGSLRLNYEDGSTVDLDKWQGGDVSLTSAGAKRLKTGRLMELHSFVMQGTGGGDAEFDEIGTQTFMLTKTGSLEVNIDELNTVSLLLTQTGSGDTRVSDGCATTGSVSNTGSGDVSIRGRFPSISKRSIGSGQIKIKVRE